MWCGTYGDNLDPWRAEVIQISGWRERETGELRDSRMETNDGISRLHSADRPIVLHGLLEQALKDPGDKFFLAFPVIFHQQPIAVW